MKRARKTKAVSTKALREGVEMDLGKRDSSLLADFFHALVDGIERLEKQAKR